MQQETKNDAKSSDPRTSRTDALLRDTFIALLERKRFESITVGDIARESKVNRATFYRHYQDKYDLAEKIIEAAFKELMRDLQTADIDLDKIDLEHRQTAWKKLFNHIAEHARLYRALLGRDSDPWVVGRMRKTSEALISKRLQESHPTPSEAAEMPEDVAIAFAIELLLGAIGWWLEDNMRHPPEQMASWFIRFISLGYFHALGFRVQS
ncbi:MAG: TetR/AcrR family transcriptional regulator [Anaerolineales bacterium]|nr:TetR/AcrR family transcriptional regulator [Anaerolineales bacterium]